MSKYIQIATLKYIHSMIIFIVNDIWYIQQYDVYVAIALSLFVVRCAFAEYRIILYVSQTASRSLFSSTLTHLSTSLTQSYCCYPYLAHTISSYLLHKRVKRTTYLPFSYRFDQRWCSLLFRKLNKKDTIQTHNNNTQQQQSVLKKQQVAHL